MGSPASTGSAQFPLLLLILLLFVGLHLSGAQSPAPAPALVPSPAVDAIAPTPLSPAHVKHPPVPAAVASPFSFSFDFTNNSNYRHDDLKFEGDAVAQTQLVDLTTCGYSSDCMGAGRVSYAHPVPFYDSTTGGGEMASFQTRFTFVILSNNKNAKGEGMAFFLAYFNSTFQGGSLSGSGGLGLMDGDGAALGTNQFVAVEFDTLQDKWDPAGDHIGIDINSVSSARDNLVASSPFHLSGYMMATITFENTTRTLVADLQFASSDGNYHSDHRVVSAQLPVTLSSLLPAQVAVGFSAATNSTSGKEQQQILSWSFNSSLALPEKVHNMKAAFIGGSIGGAVALVVVVWCILSCFRWKKSTRSHDFVTRTGGPRQFDYRDVAVATGNFSAERVIGRGAFGVVYRGTLISKGSSSSSSASSGVHSRESDALSSMESGASSNPSSKESDGGEVAVKKILNEPRGGNLDFFAEMSAISAAKHKNLVKLKGWCCKGNSQNMFDFMCWCYRKKKDDELFLVYELVPNGNLHYHLRESEQVIAWPTRYQIIKDIGSALVYLHHDCAPYILHRDIKPSNILLDNNFNAKLADFGLSRIGNQDNATLLTTAIGTEGYIDPECRKDGKVKFYRSSDVNRAPSPHRSHPAGEAPNPRRRSTTSSAAGPAAHPARVSAVCTTAAKAMADPPSPRLDEDDTFGRDFNASPSRNAAPVRSGEKRQFGDLDDDEDDVFASKKGKTKVEESAPGAATGMILSLRENLQTCKENLESNQVELEAAKSEIQKWHSAFENIPAVPAGTNPEPVSVVTYLNNLKSSEESLKEQLEKAKKREAAFIVTFAKREQEIAELKSAVRDLKTQLRPPSMQTRRLLLDPAIHEEFTRLKNLAEEKEKKIKELQENVAAVNFTPSSKHGKMLMAKCRTLQEENEEIGAMASEGKIHELGMKIAVLKTQNNELRNQFDGLYKHMDGLTNDVERSNEMVSILQEELEAKDVELARLKEMLSQKEATEDDAVVEEREEAANDMNAPSDPQPIKAES